VSFARGDGGLELDDVFDAEANTRCLERGLAKARKDGVKVKGVLITKSVAIHIPLTMLALMIRAVLIIRWANATYVG